MDLSASSSGTGGLQCESFDLTFWWFAATGAVLRSWVKWTDLTLAMALPSWRQHQQCSYRYYYHHYYNYYYYYICQSNDSDAQAGSVVCSVCGGTVLLENEKLMYVFHGTDVCSSLPVFIYGYSYLLYNCTFYLCTFMYLWIGTTVFHGTWNFEPSCRICPFPRNFYVFVEFCRIRCWPVIRGQTWHILEFRPP